jgi:hypothetical protein
MLAKQAPIRMAVIVKVNDFLKYLEQSLNPMFAHITS